MAQGFRPSAFIGYPKCSRSDDHNIQQVAQNIMVILSETGNTFRVLRWDEYREARNNKERVCGDLEYAAFIEAKKWCVSSGIALLFCPKWAEITNAEIKECPLDKGANPA